MCSRIGYSAPRVPAEMQRSVVVGTELGQNSQGECSKALPSTSLGA